MQNDPLFEELNVYLKSFELKYSKEKLIKFLFEDIILKDQNLDGEFNIILKDKILTISAEDTTEQRQNDLLLLEKLYNYNCTNLEKLDVILNVGNIMTSELFLIASTCENVLEISKELFAERLKNYSKMFKEMEKHDELHIHDGDE